MCKALELASNLYETLETIDMEYKKCNKKVMEYNAKIKDIEHVMENNDFGTVEGYWYSKTIKNLRVERRDYRDEQETLKMLKNKLKNIVDKNHVKQLTHQLEQKDESIKNLRITKTYNPRELKNVGRTNIKEYCKSLEV